MIFLSSESMSYNAGPSVEPWMAPEVTLIGADKASPTRTRNVRHVRKLGKPF